MIKHFKKLRALTKEERRWFWQCWRQFAKWHIIIQYFPYSWWKDSIFTSKLNESKHSLTFPLSKAIQISEMAARNHVFHINCLRRCMVQQQLLGQQGYDLKLHFGVKKEQGILKAHCWLTENERLVNDGPEVISTYTELTLADQQASKLVGSLR